MDFSLKQQDMLRQKNSLFSHALEKSKIFHFTGLLMSKYLAVNTLGSSNIKSTKTILPTKRLEC